MPRHSSLWPSRHQRPTGRVEIDPSHPLAQGLVLDLECNTEGWLDASGNALGLVELVTLQNAAVYGGMKWETTAMGRSLRGDGSDSYVQIPYRSDLACVSGLSLEVEFICTGTINRVLAGKPFAATHTDPYFEYCIFYSGTGNTCSFRTNSIANYATVGPTVGKPTRVLFTADGTQHIFYQDGKRNGYVSTGSLPGDTNQRPFLVGINASGGECADFAFGRVRVWKRALGAGEAAELYAEPYAFLRSAPRRAYGFAPEAAGPLLITPSVAAAGTHAQATAVQGSITFSPADAIVGTFASASLDLGEVEVDPAAASAGTHAQGTAICGSITRTPAAAVAGAEAGSPKVYPIFVTAVAVAGTTADVTPLGGLDALMVAPSPASAGVHAAMHGLRIETHGGTTVWYVLPEAAGCAAACPDPVAFGITPDIDLLVFPALQISTPREGLVVGAVGFGWLDLAQSGFTAEGELSVMGLGGGAVAFPLAEATGALLYGGLGGSGILEIAPPMTASGGDSPYSGTATAPLPFPVMTGAFLTGGVLTGSIEIRAPDADGRILAEGESAGVAVLPLLDASGAMASGMQPVEGAIGLPALHLSGLGFTGQSGDGSVVLPALALTAAGSSLATTLAGLLVLRPLDLLGEMGTQSAEDLDAPGVYVSAMNLRAEAVSDYERFPFNSYALRNGLMIAAKEDGIWELEGEKDDTFDIFAEIHKMSFDLEAFQHKRMTDAFFHLHSNGGYRIDIYADGVRSGRDVDDPGGGIHAWKVALPRGLKGQGLGIRVTNTAGSYILLDEVEMVSEFTSRRNR